MYNNPAFLAVSVERLTLNCQPLIVIIFNLLFYYYLIILILIIVIIFQT